MNVYQIMQKIKSINGVRDAVEALANKTEDSYLFDAAELLTEYAKMLGDLKVVSPSESI